MTGRALKTRTAVTMQTILIVDDEIDLRRSLAMILQRKGHLVTTAGGADEARRYLQAGPFDLVFLDLKMPDVDGLTLLSEIRACYPEMPVFILTAHATLESAIEAVRCGARDYMLKPAEPEAIIARVQEILAERIQPRRRHEIEAQLQGLLDELHGLENKVPPPADALPEALVEPSRYLQRGQVTLDLRTHQVLLRDRQISLTATVFAYLVTLLRHSPNPVSYEDLVKESQGHQVSASEARGITRGQIHEIRKALGEDKRPPRYIITVRHFGYRLVV